MHTEQIKKMKPLISFLPKAAAYFFILLFCYAAVSKLLDYENFQVKMKSRANKSESISNYKKSLFVF